MSFADTLKGLIFKKEARRARDPRDPRRSKRTAGRRPPQGAKPKTPTWPPAAPGTITSGSVVSQRQTWQVIGILSLLIALAGVGGVIHIGSQSKFIPYVVEVDKLGQTVAAGPVTAGRGEGRSARRPRLGGRVHQRRPDGDARRGLAAQGRVPRVLDALAQRSGHAKMNEWLNGTPEASPFKRAEKEMVSVEIKTVLRNRRTPGKWTGWKPPATAKAREGPAGHDARPGHGVHGEVSSRNDTDEQLAQQPHERLCP
jgi:type IV secretory pathway TrbF-like protein